MRTRNIEQMAQLSNGAAEGRTTENSGFESRRGKRFFSLTQFETDYGVCPSSYILGSQSGRNVKMINHAYGVLRSPMHGAIL